MYCVWEYPSKLYSLTDGLALWITISNFLFAFWMRSNVVLSLMFSTRSPSNWWWNLSKAFLKIVFGPWISLVRFEPRSDLVASPPLWEFYPNAPEDWDARGLGSSSCSCAECFYCSPASEFKACCKWLFSPILSGLTNLSQEESRLIYLFFNYSSCTPQKRSL